MHTKDNILRLPPHTRGYPDGNGIEVSYEIPRSQWPVQDELFLGGKVDKGRFPGPWDEHLAPQGVASI